MPYFVDPKKISAMVETKTQFKQRMKAHGLPMPGPRRGPIHWELLDASGKKAAGGIAPTMVAAKEQARAAMAKLGNTRMRFLTGTSPSNMR